MRITRQADNIFHQPIMSDDEWIQNVRHSPNFQNYSIDNHEAAEDAHDLGFVTPQEGWNQRLYKVDRHGVIYEIYPRGHDLSESDAEVNSMPRWMLKVSNLPEGPDIMARHNTLDDALDQVRSGSWMRGVKRPAYDTWSSEVKSYPTGTPFVTHPFSRILDPAYRHQSGNPRQEGTAQARYLAQRDKEIQHFHDAWNSGTHDPYARRDYDRWG